MNTQLILEASRASLADRLSFPDYVGKLVAAGVESYRVDFVTRQSTFYGADGDVASTPIPYEDLPPVAADFAREQLQASILDSQRRGQAYRDFARRAMASGVQGYCAFLSGKRITYWGRQGDQHTEWFPGAKPAHSST